MIGGLIVAGSWSRHRCGEPSRIQRLISVVLAIIAFGLQGTWLGTGNTTIEPP